MPYDHPESTDPQELVGVVLPGEAGDTREMAYTFAEEFARMGYEAPQILRMFQNPYYAGAHGAYRSLGHATTAAIIDECARFWSHVQIVDHDSPR